MLSVCRRPLHLISRNLFCPDSSNNAGNDTSLSYWGFPNWTLLNFNVSQSPGENLIFATWRVSLCGCVYLCLHTRIFQFLFCIIYLHECCHLLTHHLVAQSALSLVSDPHQVYVWFGNILTEAVYSYIEILNIWSYCQYGCMLNRSRMNNICIFQIIIRYI